MLDSIRFALIMAAVALAATGQLLFKRAAVSLPPLVSPQAFLSLFVSPWVWATAVVYAIGCLVWIVVLQRVPLSLAYPFVGLTFVAVPLGAAWVFSEPVGWHHLAGAVLIIAGIMLVATR